MDYLSYHDACWYMTLYDDDAKYSDALYKEYSCTSTTKIKGGITIVRKGTPDNYEEWKYYDYPGVLIEYYVYYHGILYKCEYDENYPEYKLRESWYHNNKLYREDGPCQILYHNPHNLFDTHEEYTLAEMNNFWLGNVYMEEYTNFGEDPWKIYYYGNGNLRSEVWNRYKSTHYSYDGKLQKIHHLIPYNTVHFGPSKYTWDSLYTE